MVAAKAIKMASNWPSGWKKNTAASMRARYFVGANLQMISRTMQCSTLGIRTLQ